MFYGVYIWYTDTSSVPRILYPQNREDNCQKSTAPLIYRQFYKSITTQNQATFPMSKKHGERFHSIVIDVQQS